MITVIWLSAEVLQETTINYTFNNYNYQNDIKTKFSETRGKIEKLMDRHPEINLCIHKKKKNAKYSRLLVIRLYFIFFILTKTKFI